MSWIDLPLLALHILLIVDGNHRVDADRLLVLERRCLRFLQELASGVAFAQFEAGALNVARGYSVAVFMLGVAVADERG